MLVGKWNILTIELELTWNRSIYPQPEAHWSILKIAGYYLPAGGAGRVEWLV